MLGSTAAHQPLAIPAAVLGSGRAAAPGRRARRWPGWSTLALGTAAVPAVIIWQAIALGELPDPLASGAGRNGETARVVEIAVLVFREGLESILVLAARVASTHDAAGVHRDIVGQGRPVIDILNELPRRGYEHEPRRSRP